MADDKSGWAFLPAKGTLEGRRRDDRLAGSSFWAEMGRRASTYLGNGNSDKSRAGKGEWLVQDWICEGMFKAETVSIIAGPPGTWKTHFALDLGIAVCYGGRWLGKYECLQGPVYYLAGELLYREIDAMKAGLLLGQGKSLSEWMDGPGKWFTAVAHREPSVLEKTPLSSPMFWSRIRDLLASAPCQAALPKLWIFDPVAYMMSGGKEEDIKPVIDNLFNLARMSHAAVVIILHYRKGKPGEPEVGLDAVRGSAIWTMYADQVIQLSLDPNDTELVRVTQSKNRGVAGEFLVRWRHTPLVDPEWSQVVQATVGDLAKLPYAVPGGVDKIERWWINPDQAPPAHGHDDHAPPQVTLPAEGEAPPPTAQEWDARTRAVLATLEGATEPVSSSRLYDMVKEKYQGSLGRDLLNKILARLEQGHLVISAAGKHGATVFRLA